MHTLAPYARDAVEVAYRVAGVLEHAFFELPISYPEWLELADGHVDRDPITCISAFVPAEPVRQ